MEHSGVTSEPGLTGQSWLQARVAELEAEVTRLRLQLPQQNIFDQLILESQSHFRSILDALLIYVVVMTPDGAILKANQRSLALAGMSMDEVVGRSFVHQQWWIAGDEVDQSIQEAIGRAQQGASSRFDIPITTKAGKRLTLDFMVSPMFDKHGEIIRLVSCGIDISDRIRFEEALGESESRFRSTFENAAVGMAQLSLDGRWLAVNDKLCSILGYSKTELLALTLRQISHPEDRAAEMTLPERMLGAGTPSASVEKRYLRKDGSTVWANVTASPAMNSQGHADYLIAVIEDITARKRAETALRESESKFRALADNIAQLAWMADAFGWIYWFNQRCFDYTGSTPEQMQGWGWQAIHDPAELPTILKAWNVSIETGQPFEMVFPLRGADGVFRPFLSRAVPVCDGRGETSGWFGTHTDITDQKRVEDALRRSNHDLEQFAYAASHDLQEPVRTVATLTQLLERHTEYSLDDQSREWMSHIVVSAKRMGTLIADLLAYSRVTLDGSTCLEAVDLNEVLSSVISQLKIQMEESGARIDIERLPMVTGSRVQLGQVFQNLISNALRFSKNGMKPEVRIEVEKRGQEWLFSVADNGQGFDPAFADRVFGIFKRLHGTDVPGNGIGLAICKTVVARHGGRMWVKTAEGEGATFYLTLPV